MGKGKVIEVSWLLNKYRKFLESKIDYLLDEILPLETVKELKGYVIEDLERKYPENTNIINLGNNANRIKKEHFKEYRKSIYDRIYTLFKENEEVDNDEEIKLKFLLLIHRDCLNNMKPKEKEEFLHMVFSEMVMEKDSELFIIKSQDKDKRNVDYQIITKDVPESVEDIKNERTRMIFMDAILNILQVDELGDSIKTKYPENAYSEILDKFQYLKERDEKKFEMALREYFAKNLQLLDKTSLLLNTAARIMLGIKMASGEKLEGVELNVISEDAEKTQVMKSSIDFVREIYIELARSVYDRQTSYQILDDDGNELLLANREKIGEFLQRCTESEYLPHEAIKKIHDQILEGFLIDDIEKRKIANINIQDLIDLSASYNEQTDEEVKKRILKCSKELFDYLKESEQLDIQGALDLFLEGSLSLEIIRSANIIDDLSEEEYNERFKTLYKEFSQGEEKDKTIAKEKLKRFSNLYRYLLENEKVNIDSLIINLITEYSEDAELDIMDMLYDLKLVSIDKAVEWIGTPILFRICEKEKLPPVKVKELFDNKTLGIDINVIADIINASPDMSQRFMLIISIFPEEEENRNKLYKKCLTIEADAKTESEGVKRKKGEGTKEYEKHEIDPAKRMKLMSLLDKDYYFEMTLDGHTIVYLPNLGQVIVEKMLNEKNEPSYGAATYIVNEEYFDENRDSIIQEGKVIRKELIKNRGEKVTKINHYIESWGRKVKEHFGIEEGSRYCKEDIEQIDKAIEEIVKSQNQIGENK